MKIALTILLLFLTWYRCFFQLQIQPIERWDESTNISVIRNTRFHHSFPILFVEDKPFFEKSPLWYYVSLLLPVHPRAISATAGFLTILLVSYIAWKWWGPLAGFISWVILLTTNHLFVTNPSGVFSTHTFRSADVDSLFILFLICSFYTDNPKWKEFFSGLAVLTKGPLGLLPLVFSLNSLGWALLTILPWYVYMMAMFGHAFISAHLGYHIIDRSIYPLEGHAQHWWYYVRLLSNRQFFLSWELLVGSLIWLISHDKWKDPKIRSVVFIAGMLFLIPTLIQTKLAWYILPFYPFAALIIGAGVSAAVSHYRRYSGRAHRK